MSDDEWTLAQYSPKGVGETWIFRKNLSDIVQQKRRLYDHPIYLTFGYQPATNGYWTEDDGDTFERLEKNELQELEERTSALLVAVVPKPGVKDFVFYSAKPDSFLEVAKKLQTGYRQFEIECECHHDLEWSQYDDIPGSE